MTFRDLIELLEAGHVNWEVYVRPDSEMGGADQRVCAVGRTAVVELSESFARSIGWKGDARAPLT